MNKHLNIHEHIINSITFPIIIIDDEKIISMVNSSAEDFFKVSSKIILGRSIKDFIPFSSPVNSLIENCIETSSSFKEYKIDLSTPMTGDHKDVDVQISMISGLPNKYQLVFLEDYYEKKLLFQNENHKNKLAMSNMSQILAHEVKNPLSGIRGAAQLLEKNLKEKDLEMTNLICKEVDRIRRLIDNLEVFDATSPLDLKSINIHTVLRHVKEIMLNSNDFELDIIENYDPSIPNVLGNQDQLIQVFINLVKNSIEAFKKGNNKENKIILSTSYEHGYVVKDNYSDRKVRLPIKISIKDNGPGIPESILPNIFQPFVSSKKNGEGGLGLSIVSKIISDHNGSIELDNHIDGSEFIIRLIAEIE